MVLKLKRLIYGWYYVFSGRYYSSGTNWVDVMRKDSRRYNNASRRKRRYIHSRGYLYRSYLMAGEDYSEMYKLPKDKVRTLISRNTFYGRWIKDIATYTKLLRPFVDKLPKVYYHIFYRYLTPVIWNADKCRVSNYDELYRFIANSPKTFVLETVGNVKETKKRAILTGEKGKVYCDGFEVSRKDIESILYQKVVVLRDYFESSKEINELFALNETSVYLTFIKSSSDGMKIVSSTVENTDKGLSIPNSVKYEINMESGEVIIDGRSVIIPHWEEIKNQAYIIASYIAELNYISFRYVIDDKCRIADICPDLHITEFDREGTEKYEFCYELCNELCNELKPSRVNILKELRNQINRRYVSKHFAKGWRSYMAYLWVEMIKDDFLKTKKPLKEKLWAWKRGYLSYRIEQYGLTEENYKEILSDRDYAWLNRMNNRYHFWVNDKLTMRYILEDFKEYLPGYYYYVYPLKMGTNIMKLPDCGEQYDESILGLISLLKDKKELAFKPNNGTHGDGFHKLQYLNGDYVDNGRIISEAELYRLIREIHSTYIVSELIHNHRMIDEFFSDSVNTVRIMVINENGVNPEAVYAYLRIGSSSTKCTDNIGYGGICCKIDIKTGNIYQPEIIKDHVFYACEKHPDTGIRIAGVLPYWDEIKKEIVEITRTIPQVEYLGYDIAITEEGFKIIEINIHQDLHKYIEYPEKAKNYFKRKIKEKKELFSERD